MNNKSLISCMVIALILISILSPAVTASVVYGPARFNRTGGGPTIAQDNFSLSALIRLNRETVVKANGNFSRAVNLTGISNITFSTVDSVDTPTSAALLLEGDMLPESRERLLGFDPQNPDSDSTLTSENEAGNGIIDGYETLGNQLPAFVKSRIGADPFKNDTDNDRLDDDSENRLGTNP